MENNLYEVLAKIAEGDKINFTNETDDDSENINSAPTLFPGYDYEDDEDLKSFLENHFPTPEKLSEAHLPEQFQNTNMEAPQKKRTTKYTVFVKKILKIVEEERLAHFEFLATLDELLNSDVLLYFLKFCPCATKKFRKLTQNDNIVVFDRHFHSAKNAKALNLIMKYILRMQPPPSWSSTFPTTEKVLFVLDAIPLKKASLWNKITKKTSRIFCTNQIWWGNSTRVRGGRNIKKTKRDYYVSKKRIIVGNDPTIITNNAGEAYKKIIVFLYDDKFIKTMAKTNKTFLRLSKMEKLFVWHFNPAKGKYQHFFLVNIQKKPSRPHDKTMTDTFLMMLTMAIFMTVMFIAVLH